MIPSLPCGLLVLENLLLDGRRGLASVGDPEPQLLRDHGLLSHARAKLEGDDVRVLLLGSDLEDVAEGVLVFDSAPPSTVRQFPQYCHGVT